MGKGKGRGPWKIWLSVGALAAFGICLALVSAGQRSRGKQFTAFFAMTGDSVPEDNRMIRRIAERTGVRVSVEWLNGQISSERIESMIRMGEYPDFINGSGDSDRLVAAGALVPLDGYLDK